MTNPHGVSLTAATGTYRAEYKGKYLGRHKTKEIAEYAVLAHELGCVNDRYVEISERMSVLVACGGVLVGCNKELAKYD